ncbi:MAG: mycothiol synthase [Beutenbergiaceae bacterium]
MRVVDDPDPAAVRSLAVQVADCDGVAAFSEQTLLNLDADRPVTHIALTDGEELAGYAQVDGDSGELAIHPRHRRQGLGAQLLDMVLARPGVNVWAHGPTPGAAPLAASRALAITRELWLMTAPPPVSVPAPVVPDGLMVATFTAADAEDWVAVNARAFAAHPEQGRMTRSDLAARMAEPWFDPTVFWLARDSATHALLGSMWVKIADGVGEIYVLGIDPQAQGRGIGSLLTAFAMHAFAQRDLTGVELYVEGDNAAAIRTYRRAGFTRARADLQYARPR